MLYDKEGDYHFDTISAFIKSLRGSDPDAALYWMARMIRAGEDPHFLFRRMLISACEDVGMADPMAITVVEAAAAAFDRVGLPEGQFHLTHAALYLATAPKSNSALGFFDALKAVEEEGATDVPSHLKDASRDKEGFGHGEGYLYPHAYRDHWVAQAYLPASLRGRSFYHPSHLGYESGIREEVERRRELQLAAMLEPAPQEILTFSPESREFRRWVARISASEFAGSPASGTATVSDVQEARRYRGDAVRPQQAMALVEILSDLRDRLYGAVEIFRHSRVFLFDPGVGTLTWESVRRAREGLVYSVFPEPQLLEVARHLADALPQIEQPVLRLGTILDPLDVETGIDRVVARDPVTRGLPRNAVLGVPETYDEEAGSATARLDLAFGRIAELLESGGTFAVSQIVPRDGARLSDFVSFEGADEALGTRVIAAEELIYSNKRSLLVGWGKEEILAALDRAGLADCSAEVVVYPERRLIRATDVDRWLDNRDRPEGYGAVMRSSLSDAEHTRYRELLAESVADKQLAFRICVCYVSGRKP